MEDHVKDYDEWKDENEDKIEDIEQEDREGAEEVIEDEFGKEGLEEVEEDDDRGNKKFLAQFYIGTNVKKWQTVWAKPTFEMEAGRATVAYRSREDARATSDDGTVVRIANVDVDAIIAFIDESSSDDNDWTYADNYKLSDKLKIYEKYDRYLIDLFKYRKLLKASRV